MKHYPIYMLVVVVICMLAVLSYAPIPRVINWASLFWTLFGIIVGIVATLIRFTPDNVRRYGMMD